MERRVWAVRCAHALGPGGSAVSFRPRASSPPTAVARHIVDPDDLPLPSAASPRRLPADGTANK
ncbi:hypothetical protein [Streptomyces atriruber]|uniref:hypothetical protein n=1 Tax=Streptomyces atriruber TaxID=545121 RepID=UPI0006E23978|nr:hypothetical protein [Streptomyces atriruber]